MTTTTIFNFLKKPAAAGTGSFLALLLLTQLISYQHYLLFRSTTNREQVNAANLAKEKLQKALANSQVATQTLSFIVKKYGINEDFDVIGKQILASNKYIDAVELLEGGTITHVYPLKGNESVIGYNILADSNRNIEAEKAIQKRDLFFAGPFTLKQGGIAIVGRLPIFINNKFWGFAVTLVKLSTLIDAADIDTTDSKDYLYQLSKINPESRKEEFFLPNPQTFKKNLAVSVEVPTGEWKIYVMPRNPQTVSAFMPFSVLGLLLSLTGGLFAFFMARQPFELKKLVDRQSHIITKSQENYKNTLDRVSDAFASIDTNWCFTYMNQKAGETFKRDHEKVIGKNLWDEFDIKPNAPLYLAFHQALSEQRFIYQDRYIERLAGWFEIFIYPSPNGLSVFFRDITAKKLAEQEADREKYLSDAIVNSLPGVFYLYNREGKFLRWNKNFELVSGYTTEEVAQMHPLDFFDNDEKGILQERIENVFRYGMSDVEANLLTKTGEKIPYYFNGYTANFSGEECLIGTGIDISTRKKAEQAIRDSEEKYRYLFDNNPALIFIWDLETYDIMEVNRTAEEEYGYSRNELLNMKVMALRPAEEHEKIRLFAARMLTESTIHVRGTWKHMKKSGEIMHMDIRSHKITYNNRLAILSLAENVTEKVKIEEQLKRSYEDIRLLNTHLQTVREEERAGIAREIHDELGQQLTALKMDVSWVKKRAPQDNHEMIERLSGMITLIDQTVKIVRRIASDLRPGILDDLGLIAALEWQLSEFEKRMSIKTTFHAQVNSIEPDKKLCIGVFRMFQEALTNVARHSGATQLDISVAVKDELFCLTISDNGHGFDTLDISSKNTLGLIGMAERARMLHGELVIESKPGKGTHIIIKVPIQINV